MTSAKKIISILVLFVAIAASFFWWRQSENTARINSLKFSNTMEWDPVLLKLVDKPTHFIPNWKDFIVLPPPPLNSSAETKADIATMLSYIPERTPEHIQEIKLEANIFGAELGGKALTSYLDSEKFPFTTTLLTDSFNDVTIMVMTEKKRFDRVRPSFLEPKLEPVIPIPGHSAYPSGHSTQAHLLAYLLGELMPDKKQQLINEADAIAKNREVAGLHYPGDTKAGVSLARQFVDLLLKDPEFQGLLEKARQEWQ